MVEFEYFDAGQRFVQRFRTSVLVGHLLDLFDLQLICDQTVRHKHRQHHTDAGNGGQAQLSPDQEHTDHNL